MRTYAVQKGLYPGFSPLQPGGDYWDTAFLDLSLEGLRQRRMGWHVLDRMFLSSYGFTFSKPLSWGKGGPERWSVSKPYLTPEGQQDQIGFHNFEWAQGFSKRSTGIRKPVIILNAGYPELFSANQKVMGH